ncbi:putative allergen [Aspergillus stella-maris]|uniref:putative allergen n=1 Tax=Aspergillus stella-maris TaxID=1810926 RepID=UPI003CCD2729
MQFSKTLMLLAALATSTLARPEGHERRQASASATTTSTPSSTSSASSYSTSGFGARTANSGSGNTYQGNVGSPWGSNIIEVSESDAQNYQHVAKISGQNTEAWDVIFFNKYGPNGLMDGWFGFTALKVSVDAGETKYVAFDDDTNGGFAAAPSGAMPLDISGGYASTWGEFDFSSSGNGGWSGFDVSAITAQNANKDVQGMRICEEASGTCSSITPGAASVDNAYTAAETDVGGIGGNISGDRQIILDVTIDYQG